MIKNKIIRCFLVVILGGLLPCAFSPLSIWPLGILVIAAFFLLLHRYTITTKEAMALGFCFGLGFFGIGTWWIYISIHTYGLGSIGVSTFITLLSICYLSLYTCAISGLWFYLFKQYRQHFTATLAFPAIWVIFEWLRSHILTGFPWLNLGYMVLDNPLSGFAPMIGLWGLSFVVCLHAVLISYLILRWSRKKIRYIIIGSTLLMYGLGAVFNQINWTDPIKKKTSLAIIQGNISQKVKWTDTGMKIALDRYMGSIKRYATNRVFILPEGAITSLEDESTITALSGLHDVMRKNGKQVIFGTILPAMIPNTVSNGLMVLGANSATYRKRVLVPFGEYVPLLWLFRPLIHRFQMPMSDLVAGNKQQSLLRIQGQLVAPFICFEVAYPELVWPSSADANWLLTLSDDSWFGDSWARDQQLQIARLRALETRKPMIYATNNGVTAVISAWGKILKRLPPNRYLTLTTQLTGRRGQTWVNAQPAWAIPFILIVLLVGCVSLSTRLKETSLIKALGKQHQPAREKQNRNSQKKHNK